MTIEDIERYLAKKNTFSFEVEDMNYNGTDVVFTATLEEEYDKSFLLGIKISGFSPFYVEINYDELYDDLSNFDDVLTEHVNNDIINGALDYEDWGR